MKMKTRRIYLDLAIKILIVVNLGLFALFSCAKIGERLDEQAQAEDQYIEAYKAELKETQNKETN